MESNSVRNSLFVVISDIVAALIANPIITVSEDSTGEY